MLRQSKFPWQMDKSVAYDKLILASGAHPNVPPFPGRELKGVQTLRTLEDADLIMDVARQQAKVICIGGGLLGLEVAGGSGTGRALK